MALSAELINRFVEATNDKPKRVSESTVYGTVYIRGGLTYAKFDGSQLLTPVTTTASVKDGDRVAVRVKDHTATITGNFSDPSASGAVLDEVGGYVTNIDLLIADKASVEELAAETARIDALIAENVIIQGKLTAGEATIGDLSADNAIIKETLVANDAAIKKLDAEKLSATAADIKYATIDNLKATNAEIYNLSSTYGEFVDLTTKEFEAVNGTIQNLDTKYANIDFSNIDKAAMEYFYANSGLIKDVTIGDATITGKLVGVTISGDLIEGNTIKAEKLVIKGEDGLYYKLNTNGTTVTSEQTEYNSLNGSILLAKSVTAEKVSVKDLVAFGATIGGFHIGDQSIYSGVKESVDNTTRGIYLDTDGQMAIGDNKSYLKYYKAADGTYKLEVSASSVTFGNDNKNLDTALGDIQDDVDSLRDEITTLLRIESSRGTVFKNDAISTVLSVIIYHGTKRIIDSATMKSVFGSGAYLQWKWQRLDEDSYGVISSSDSRFGDDGFTFTLSPEDVDTKVTFMCELIV